MAKKKVKKVEHKYASGLDVHTLRLAQTGLFQRIEALEKRIDRIVAALSKAKSVKGL